MSEARARRRKLLALWPWETWPAQITGPSTEQLQSGSKVFAADSDQCLQRYRAAAGVGVPHRRHQ